MQPIIIHPIFGWSAILSLIFFDWQLFVQFEYLGGLCLYPWNKVFIGFTIDLWLLTELEFFWYTSRGICRCWYLCEIYQRIFEILSEIYFSTKWHYDEQITWSNLQESYNLSLDVFSGHPVQHPSGGGTSSTFRKTVITLTSQYICVTSCKWIFILSKEQKDFLSTFFCV